jgi:glutaminyl-tRNA synthetase
MAVLRPVKLTITNYPEDQSEELTVENNPVDESAGTRTVTFSRHLYVEAEDFMEEPIPKYKRLTPGGQECRLKGAYLIRCTGCVKDEAGNVVEILCEYDPESQGGNPADGRKVKGATIHWVDAATAVDAEVRLYDYLFSDEDPDGAGKNFLDCLNPNSLQTLTGCKVEAGLAQAEMPTHGKTATAYQFLRQGYFCLDNRDAAPGRLVFNRSVSLKDSFKKK